MVCESRVDNNTESELGLGATKRELTDTGGAVHNERGDSRDAPTVETIARLAAVQVCKPTRKTAEPFVLQF